ncbi:hypothetical protein GOP47_0025074 [Adiantum capillus-veneris]|uniref:RING-type domain-containing protein n=1 Tax=Adiantum capillus-veneris TaxID=13818 RepID=A0A9D4Z480_ADICA|nr:hypothetical protein GOP47_0025074 [Adiantum capillus-veneris]
MPEQEKSEEEYAEDNDDSDSNNDEEDDDNAEEQDEEDEDDHSDENEDSAEEAEIQKDDEKEEDAPAPPSGGISQKAEGKKDSCLPAGKPCSSSPWINQTLACIRDARNHLDDRQEMLAHPSPESYIPHLRRVQSAALALLSCTDAAISCAYTESVQGKVTLKQELAAAQKKLKISETQYRHSACSLRETRARLENQKVDFQREKATLKSSYNEEKTALLAANQVLKSSYNEEKTALLATQRALERELEDEKDKSICCVCHEKPRDTVILPCLHFQYCFGCLLRHREVNSNTCPSCRGPIQGLSMSSFLAGQ